jgi:hypothetical protein
MSKEEDSDYQKVKEGNISLVLESYNEIFSSFDPRFYTSRALSHDFLSECQRATLDKGDKIELRLLVPKEKRSYIEEAKIKKRLSEHFVKHFKEKEKEQKKVRFQGIFWFFLGFLIMALEFILMHYGKGIFPSLLTILATPAGWFFFWEGLDKVFIYSKENKLEYDFYKKMSKSEISFFEY